MIDFRYHLVSLISVFLALAVGIVLGAGPLRENLGDQLAGQVEQLRTEKEQLRGESEELTARNDQLAGFVNELGPELVAGTLQGDQVAVLAEGDTTRAGVERIGGLLEDAGVAGTTTIQLQPALWAPDEQQQRTDALEAIAQIAPAALPEDPSGELTDSARLAGLIPTLLSPGRSEELTVDLREQLWQVLVDHQLVALDGTPPGAVDGVLYASAAPEDLTVDGEDELVAAERAQALLAMQTELLGVLSGTGLPAVVSAATPANDASTGILRTVRGDAAFDALSTTDRLQEADGPLLAVLALVEQSRGGSGAYGTTADADDRLPALPETSGLGTGDGTSGGTGGTGDDTTGDDTTGSGTTGSGRIGGGPSDGGGEG